MPKVGDVTLMDESFDRFLTMAEEGATTVYSVAGVTFRMDALRSITADGAVTIEPEPTNPHDPHAHKVLVDGVHVGYLKRGRAPPEAGARLLGRGEHGRGEVVGLAGEGLGGGGVRPAGGALGQPGNGPRRGGGGRRGFGEGTAGESGAAGRRASSGAGGRGRGGRCCKQHARRRP